MNTAKSVNILYSSVRILYTPYSLQLTLDLPPQKYKISRLYKSPIPSSTPPQGSFSRRGAFAKGRRSLKM